MEVFIGVVILAIVIVGLYLRYSSSKVSEDYFTCSSCGHYVHKDATYCRKCRRDFTGTQDLHTAKGITEVYEG
ncbi:MAG: hypothetical protein K9H64_08515 [Bacteroidales bacterium]|nr:hypothetical protein [Bacteroidales bacterium]MCF8455874.1 hypothetical protein [Bacteroidales bacterium]